MNTNSFDFLKFCCDQNILQWGEFTLKSGRVSPYFFNSGNFSRGKIISKLGEFYANAIVEQGIEFDMLFGTAYKGIPIVCATAIALANQHNIDKPYCFDRKAVKQYSEKGQFVGGPPKGRLLLLDDVLTSGLAIREVLPLLNDCDITLSGILLAFDRSEPGQSKEKASLELAKVHNVPVISLINFEQLVDYLKKDKQYEQAARMQRYNDQYKSD